MLSEKEKLIIQSVDYISFVEKRSRLSWWLFILTTSMVVIYDVISIFFPSLAGSPVFSDGVLSYGVVSAFVIVLLIVASAIYYVYWVNREFSLLHSMLSIKSEGSERAE